MIYLHIAIKFNLVKNKNKNITLSFKVFSTFQNSSSQTRLLLSKNGITTQTF